MKKFPLLPLIILIVTPLQASSSEIYQYLSLRETYEHFEAYAPEVPSDEELMKASDLDSKREQLAQIAAIYDICAKISNRFVSDFKSEYLPHLDQLIQGNIQKLAFAYKYLAPGSTESEEKQIAALQSARNYAKAFKDVLLVALEDSL